MDYYGDGVGDDGRTNEKHAWASCSGKKIAAIRRTMCNKLGRDERTFSS